MAATQPRTSGPPAMCMRRIHMEPGATVSMCTIIAAGAARRAAGRSARPVCLHVAPPRLALQCRTCRMRVSAVLCNTCGWRCSARGRVQRAPELLACGPPRQALQCRTCRMQVSAVPCNTAGNSVRSHSFTFLHVRLRVHRQPRPQPHPPPQKTKGRARRCWHSRCRHDHSTPAHTGCSPPRAAPPLAQAQGMSMHRAGAPSEPTSFSGRQTSV